MVNTKLLVAKEFLGFQGRFSWGGLGVDEFDWTVNGPYGEVF
jgi:hypothetical protein